LRWIWEFQTLNPHSVAEELLHVTFREEIAAVSTVARSCQLFVRRDRSPANHVGAPLTSSTVITSAIVIPIAFR
jgi:hypothetical protein